MNLYEELITEVDKIKKIDDNVFEVIYKGMYFEIELLANEILCTLTKVTFKNHTFFIDEIPYTVEESFKLGETDDIVTFIKSCDVLDKINRVYKLRDTIKDQLEEYELKFFTELLLYGE